MDRFLRPFLFVLTVFALLPPGISQSRADERRKATPMLAPAPPPAMPQKVRVVRGQKADVPLRIYGRKNEPLKYLIKTRPEHGKISEPRAVEREVSMVTYEPPADFAITADRFTFSVQNSAGVSAPVEVAITIVDEAPILAIPATLEFGSILVGAPAVKDFEITNRGGGLADGEVKVAPPWKLEGPGRYQLAAGEKAAFKIAFAPTGGGEFRGEVRFTSDLDHTTALRGLAAMPISAEPASVELKHAPGSALRTGVFEIVNRTDEVREFQLEGGTRLRLDPKVTVPAGGRVAVAVNLPASDVTAIDEAVRVSGTGLELRVPVKSTAVGPVLQVDRQRISLGRLAAERGGQVTLEITNAGGQHATVNAEVAAPFGLAPSTFLLAPGEKRPAVVIIQPAAPGPYRGWLKLSAGAATAEVEVEADLANMTSGPRSRTTPPRQGAGRSRESKAAAVESTPWMPDLNIARAIRVTEVQPTSARLEWPADISDATTFRVERLMFTKDTAGDLRNVWLEIPHPVFSREGPQWLARLTNLIPAQSQTLRVVAVDDSKAPGNSLFRIEFITPPARRGIQLPSLLQSLVGALVITVGLLFWKRRRTAA